LTKVKKKFMRANYGRGGGIESNPT